MVNWKITAATIFCDNVDDEVTLLVYNDGAVKCVSCPKYLQPDKETAKIIKEKSKRLKRQVACAGSGCTRVTQYRDRLLAEESEPR